MDLNTNNVTTILGKLRQRKSTDTGIDIGIYYTIRKCGSNEFLIDMAANGRCKWGFANADVIKFATRKSCEVFNDIAEGIITRNYR